MTVEEKWNALMHSVALMHSNVLFKTGLHNCNSSYFYVYLYLLHNLIMNNNCMDPSFDCSICAAKKTFKLDF